YCAQCDQIAAQQNNPKLRSRLSGRSKTDNAGGSYRHRPGLECGCKHRQVHSSDLEADFLRLCQLLSVDESALTAMQNFAADMFVEQADSDRSMAEKKAAALAKCQRKLQAARHLYEEGDIDRDEYIRRKQQLDRELAYWQNYSTQTEKLNVQL